MHLLLLLLACPPTSTTGDLDGDGVLDFEDCEPEDPTIFAGAPDLCDGVDNDCDQTVDEDADFNTWYRDQDDDSFGDPSQPRTECRRPSGYVKDNTDCQPSDPTGYPGAVERCGNVDHDCDGEINDPDAVDPLLWYPDTDEDGFGNPLVIPTAACVGPQGYVGNLLDCNDDDPEINPRAPEICDDADVDEDCDFLPDEADEWFAEGQQAFPDADGDGFGSDAAEPAWYCDIPVGYVSTDTDCDDTRADINTDGTEVCNGHDDDCEGTIDEGAVDSSPWYLDRDEDGYGDPTVSVLSCPDVSGYSRWGTDCDDRNNQYHPNADESSCGSQDYNCDGFTGTSDNDGDGYIACEDCDDGAVLINPAAEEICNSLDDDCDNIVDLDAADAQTWYADLDLDGFGNPNVTEQACDQPYLHVADSSDCDDSDDAVHPGVPEDCLTNADDDCDGNGNEEGALNCLDFYADADGDSYGANLVCTCVAPAGYNATRGGDCDDGSAQVNPGAAEYCSTVDLDCDGRGGPCDILVAETLYSGSGGNFGWSVGFGDFNGDTVPDVAVGAPLADGLFPNAGVLYVSDGSARGTLASALEDLGERSADDAGNSLAMADANSDGLAEIVVGVPGSNKVGASGGVAYMLLSPMSGRTDLSTSTVGMVGHAAGDMVGGSVAYVGDVNTDARGDYAAGGRYANGDGRDRGVVYLFDRSAGPGLIDIGTGHTQIYGEADEDHLSITGELGDLDGDGIPETGAGAPDHSDGGALYILPGPVAGVISVSTVSWKLTGPSGGDAGAAFGRAGDVDGDGLGDLWVSAPDHGAGKVYLVQGGTGATSLSQSYASFTGTTSGDSFGYTGAGNLDLDGDGASDLIIGAPNVRSAGTDAGMVYVYAAPGSGSYRAADATIAIPGEDPGDLLGTSLIGVPDQDGDQQDEFLVGAPAWRNQGRVYLVYGGNLL